MTASVQVALIVCSSGLLGLALLIWAVGRPRRASPDLLRPGLYYRLLDTLSAVSRDPSNARARRDLDGAVNACFLGASPGVVAVARRCRDAIGESGSLPPALEAELLDALRADLGLEPLAPSGPPSRSA